MRQSWEPVIAAMESASQVQGMFEHAELTNPLVWEWACWEVAMLEHWAEELCATDHVELGQDFGLLARAVRAWLAGMEQPR